MQLIYITASEDHHQKQTGNMSVKTLCFLFFVVMAVGVKASREIRSPGGSRWQGFSGFGSARSSSGWSGSGLGRSQGGWGGQSRYGSGGGDYSNGFSGRSSGCSSGNGWDSSSLGFRSNGGGYSSGW